MKSYIFLTLFFLLTQLTFGQDIPEILKKYEKGIIVTHSKDTIYAEVYNGSKPNRMKYVWNYETSVKTKNKELEIVEFGGYNYINNEWDSNTIFGRPFNKSEFSKWYSCENGILKLGETYSDKKNWTTSDYIYGDTKTGLWYFIGKDSNGQKYIGYKKFVLVGKLRDK